jgi:hypothetical protein
MEKSREMAASLTKIQKAFPRVQHFLALYADGSGGLFTGTANKAYEKLEWCDGEEGDKTLRKYVKEVGEI